MLKKTLIILLAFALSWSISAGKNTEYYLRFEIADRTELDNLTNLVSIVNVTGDTAYAFANELQLQNLQQRDFVYEILPHPSDGVIRRMAETTEQLRSWDSYPTYTAYVDMMYQFAANYPSLCVVEDIGTTVNGRSILYAKISDNVNVEEDEPEVNYSSSMHGNETVGYILTLRLIDSLLVSYGTDSLVTRLIDSCEIWINPLANPDGAYFGGDNNIFAAQRANANGIDINRNFPDFVTGDHPDGNEWQPETIIMMDFADAHSFVLSANMHSGVEVINYPWDSWSINHTDDAWFIDISRQYADSAQYYSPYGYMDYLNNGITNGYDWYLVHGGRQDFMNYWHGCREITFELSNQFLLDEAYLDDFWNYNKVSLLDYLEHALYGIRGVVTDVITGLPVAATVKVIDHDIHNSHVYTDPDVGDYHRMIAAGVYDLEFSANNYYTDTLHHIVVTDLNTVIADIELVPFSAGAVVAFDQHSIENPQPNDLVDFYITLANDGDGDAVNANGILSCGDGYITVTQASSSYPTITALTGTGISLSAYQFSVDPACPSNHTVVFQLDITADGSYSNTVYFNVTINPIVEDFETDDLKYLPWESYGDNTWSSISTGSQYEGSYCVLSGYIGDNQSTSLAFEAETVHDDVISFYYKVSTELNADYLKFYLDGVEYGAFSGMVDWTKATYTVPAGPHSFEWKYEKNGSGFGGGDVVYIDYIILPELVSNIAIISETLFDGEFDHAYSESFTATGYAGYTSWIDKYDDLFGTGLTISTDGIISGTPTIEGTLNFIVEVTDEIGGTAEEPFSLVIVPSYDCGDVNQDHAIDILDIVYLINYKYKGGPAPADLNDANVNSDANIDILDVVVLINFKYKGGPDPNCPIM